VSTKEYRQSANGKAVAKQYKQRPEVKAKEAEYAKQYWRTGNGKKRNRKYRESEHYKAASQAYHKKRFQTPRGRAGHLCSAAKERAKTRNLTYSINIDIIEERLKYGKCEVTGMELDFKPSVSGVTNPYAPSLDQKNPGQGYTKENVQIVAWWYNRLKSDLTDEAAMELIKKIQQVKFAELL
jgi:hypothetical protein